MGYKDNFIGEQFKIDLPELGQHQQFVSIRKDKVTHVLDYTYYSVVNHKLRRIPIFSASNIFRTKFVQNERSGEFKLDDRLNSFEQLTNGDYVGFNKIKALSIDKGHMTKREDVQWDIEDSIERAEAAAESTFFYPNAAPQHSRLNRRAWKKLENSIIIKGRVKFPYKVSVFTGPVLDNNDPIVNTTLLDGSIFKIPVLFWKVIYYAKEDKQLYYAGFLMGQITLLENDGIITHERVKSMTGLGIKQPLKPFLEFDDSEKYQVPVSLIEQLTKLIFFPAIDPHKHIPYTKLEDVQVKSVFAFNPNIIHNILA